MFNTDDLKDLRNLSMEDLKSLIGYQKYLFESSENGLALISKDTERFIKVNPAFLELTDSSEEELKNTAFLSFINSLNYKNQRSGIKTLDGTTTFSIFNRTFKKLSIKIERANAPLCHNSLLVTVNQQKSKDRAEPKKDKTITTELLLISKIAEEINRSLDIDTILTNTLERVAEATASDVAWIMFMDDHERLNLVHSRGMSKELVEDLKKYAIAADIGSRKKALFLGKAIEANIEVSEDTMTGFLAKRENLASIVTVPLKTQKKAIGIMNLGRRKKKDYRKRELKLLDAIGNHVVIAINNARLYEKVTEQLGELKVKNEQLQELEKMKKKLTSMIVHDLKSPLTGIMGYSEYLQINKDIENEKLNKFLQLIYLSSKDILQMIMNLLDISRIEEDKLELNFSPVKPLGLIDEVLDKLKIKLLKKKLKIIKNIPSGLPVIMVDRGLITRVFVNLLDNAIKYSKKNGVIQINIKIIEGRKEVIFCILDEGRGIARKYHQKIFDSFFSLDPKDEELSVSTGIGLSFCKLAVEAHGGKIWIEDNIPYGSMFFFTIPM